MTFRQLEAAPKLERFLTTFESFKREFDVLKDAASFDESWVETTLTWANILIHRVKLA